MSNRRRGTPLTFSKLWDRYLVDGVVGVFLLVIAAFGVGLLVFSLFAANNNESEVYRQKVAQQLYAFGPPEHNDSARMIAEREHAAQQFVLANNLAVKFGADTLYDQLNMSAQEWQSIVHEAKTGVPAIINTHRIQYSTYFLIVEWPALPWLLLVIATAILIIYAYKLEDLYEHYYLSDLPWEKVWPWVFSFFLGPVGWVVMAVDVFKMRAAEAPPPRVVADTDGGSYPTAYAYRDPAEIWVTDASTTTVSSSLKKYASAPKSALAIYLRLRSGAAQQRRKRRSEQISRILESLRYEAKSHSERIRNAQSEIGKLTAEKVALDAITAAAELDDPAIIEQEFESILHLPNVVAVQVVNDRIRVICRAQVSYADKLYDAGDYVFDIGEDIVQMEARCIRSNLRANWEAGKYPDYRYDSGRFCFGDRQFIIDEHIAKGQYLEAIALTVECLCSANGNDVPNIPRAFKPIVERETS